MIAEARPDSSFPRMRTRFRRPRTSRSPSLAEKNYFVAWSYIVVSLALGWIMPRLDSDALADMKVGHDQVIAFLSAVSTGMMAFTGIVFSLLFVLMQFGSSAYSPHLVALLSRNPTLAHAQGVFTGTFLYSLMALRAVGVAAGGHTVALTIWTAFAWLLASIFLLMRLVRVFATLEITDVLEKLGESGQREIEHIYEGATDGVSPAAAAPAGPVTQTLLHRGRPRYLVDIDLARLVALAQEADAVIRIPVACGDAITMGTTIARVEGSKQRVSEDSLRKAIVLGRDRSREASPKNTIRLLIDIAIRALSPAINDPTTAVHSLDQIEDLLVRLGNAPLDIGVVADEAGTVRLVYATPTWEEYLDLSLAEIQQYGAGFLQVERRLAALLALLRARVRATRLDAIERWARLHRGVVERAFDGDSPARERAGCLDRQGLGHTLNGNTVDGEA